MAPLTKDTLEIASPAGESVVSQSTNENKSATGHMRSDAVSLEVSVRVHGSKVKNAVPGTTPLTEPFEEQTITMIIFPQGAVLKLITPVNVGQMLVVTNLKSRQDAICRVVKVRANANLAAYVEVEFTNRQPGYWGTAFPSDTPGPAAKVAPPPIDLPPAVPESPKTARDISWAPPAPPSAPAPRPLETKPAINEVKPAVASPKTFTSRAKLAPSFISIGSQEEVQPAASATATVKPGSARESAHENFAPLIPKTPAASEIPPPPPASLSMPELQGDADPGSSSSAAATYATAQDEIEILAAAAQSSPPENSRSTFGSFAGGATLAAARSTSSESFGAGFEPNEAASASYGEAPERNWTLIAACAVLAIVVLGGGFFYFRGHSTDSSSNGSPNNGPAAPNPPAAAVSQSTQAARPIVPANEDPMAGASNSPVDSVAPMNVDSSPTPAVSAANTAKPPQPAPNAPPQPSKPAKPAAPKVTPGMMSQSLSAHPTSSQRAHASAADAPALDDDSATAAAQPNALAGIPSSNNGADLPAPTIQQEAPVKIGGNVKEPRLISTVMPVYPIGAIQAGVSGDVVIQTTIDKDGKVAAMHVVSGSPILRQAALDALRRWKYEPSTLDGQPVAAQLQVTIKFRR